MRRWRPGVALAGIALASVAAAAEPRPAPRRVLQICESNPELSPAYAAFLAEFRAALPLGERVELRTESFDASRLADAEFRAAFRTWLASAYSGSAPPELIVAVGEVALGFLSAPGSTPWPGVPVVFGALDERAPVLGRLPSGFTGVTEHFAIRETVELALRLLPGARSIALFGGASPRDEFYAGLLRQEVSGYADRLQIIDLVGLPLPGLLERIRALPDDTFVVGVSYIRDAEGQHWDVRRVVQRMAEAGKAPVFIVYRQGVGTGAMGGVVADYRETGRRVAGQALRVLEGESPAAIPIERAGPYRSVLDARQLDRWHVPEARVPAGAEIVFREIGPWRRFRWQILAGLTAIALQALLIGGLLVERRNRRMAERQGRENLAQIAHMNRVGAVGQLAGAFAHELNTPLGAALNNAAAARRFLSQGPEGAAEVMACLDDIVGDVRRAGQVVERIRGALRREDVEQHEVETASVIHEAVRLVEADALDRDVALSIDLAPGLGSLSGDKVQLVQVLVNLIKNAVDALAGMPPDRQRISVAAAPVRDGVEIEVADTGPGIPAENLERVFEPFFTTKSSGLGMGLAISRSIVQAHGGRIWATAAQHRGTAFHVFLPAQAEAAAGWAMAARPGAGCRGGDAGGCASA